MAEQELLVRSANDITETWVLNLLQYHHHHNLSGIGGTVRLRKWCLQDLKSKETLGGGCSSRVIVKVEYEVMGDVEHPATTEEQLKEETFVVKTVPSQGVMVDMLTSEGLHHSEVNQYGKFLRVLVTWEAERRGVDVGMMAEIVPSHVLAVSDDHYFTLVLPDLTQLGYQTRLLEEGLSGPEVMVTARALGRFHGTAVAFKMVTKTNLQDSFPTCFHVAHDQSELFTFFHKAGFERLHQEWEGLPERAALLSLLKPYETHATTFVVHNLLPREPFATAIHGDPQPTNILFKYTADGDCTIKLIDWAQARYSKGTYDLVYMLSIGVEPEVRRQVSSQAKEEYFKAFNDTLKDLDAGLAYPRNVFDEDMMLSEQLSVVWCVSSINLLYSSTRLQRRLYCILNDILYSPSIKPLHYFLPESSSSSSS
ncbi:uncharacterized protein [Cherax quadricarinatus]|uniref:uncharacterized protein n=1 Tax=Cherax quadricarinatus TaxID=27406 RepID=UPI0023791644|nr:uncharacterized protein LOC128704764 [Cherax quadricarinatus]XP_053655874.1 uncharacterized protein LOC128704764 [Cherax quadricarinatus]